MNDRPDGAERGVARRRAIRRELVLTVFSGLLAGAMLVAAFAPAPNAENPRVASDGVVTFSAQAERGRTLAQAKGCVACHAMPGFRTAVPIGPDLNELTRVAATRRSGMSTEDYIRESILAPEAFVVPGYENQMPQLPVDAAELDAIVAFLLGR